MSAPHPPATTPHPCTYCGTSSQCCQASARESSEVCCTDCHDQPTHGGIA